MLYKKITIISKLNRLIPFFDAFLTLSHLNFIFYGTNKNSNQNKDKFVIEENILLLNKSQSFESFSSESFPVKLFFEFCQKNKKIINLLLRRYPQKFPNELQSYV